jgi:hypothetical protein
MANAVQTKLQQNMNSHNNNLEDVAEENEISRIDSETQDDTTIVDIKKVNAIELENDPISPTNKRVTASSTMAAAFSLSTRL